MLGALVVALVVGVVLLATDGSRPSPTTVATSAPTSAPPTTTTTTVPLDPGYPVQSTSFVLSEPVSGGADRSLPTTVQFPTVAPAGRSGTGTPRATPPFPLVVFSQGYNIEPTAYSSLLATWASAGYVVAIPTYPFTSPSSPSGVNESDMVNHPADLRFVITSLLQMSATTGGALSGLINPDEVGVIGHSDGGDVSLAVAANTCCQDPRVKAAVILSGAEQSLFGGTYFATPAVPMLVTQGVADIVNVPACSVDLYNQAPQPKYFLSLEGPGAEGASHMGPYTEPGPALDTVEKVTVDFLDATLKHSAAAQAAIGTDGTVPGVATLTTGASVPPVAGICTGAPGA
jgi:predicted dienelactone hydrolase